MKKTILTLIVLASFKLFANDQLNSVNQLFTDSQVNADYQLNSVDQLYAENQDFAFGNIKPFTTDACSAFPEGTQSEPELWKSCCVEHDLKYWAGGTKDEKHEADLGLYRCVAAKGKPKVAILMYEGVRIGGSPYFYTPYRWGYGWEFGRGYTELSAAEKEEVKKHTPEDLSQVPVTHSRVSNAL